jgi:uncharacterized protein
MALTYLDTCIVLSLHVADVHTEAVTQSVKRMRGPIAMSLWAQVEIASALGAAVRRRDISAKLASVAFEEMQAFCAAAKALPVSPAALELATRSMLDFQLGLRAGDALHLALCKLNKASLMSTDTVLCVAARKLGVKVLNPVE